MKKVKNQTFDEEHSLYNLKNTSVINCTFAGKADGESVLKECRNYEVIDCSSNPVSHFAAVSSPPAKCSLSLRYLMWHAKKFALINSNMYELARAPL